MMAVNTSTASHSGADLSSKSAQSEPAHDDSGRIGKRAQKIHRPIQLTRRRSKGTIAGFADAPFNRTDLSSNLSMDLSLNKSSLTSTISRNSVGKYHNNASNNLSVAMNKTQQLQSLKNAAIQTASKSSHVAQLALLCINATAKLGPRLKLSLCPKKMRKRIFQERLKSKRSHSRSQHQDQDEEDEMFLLDEFQQEDDSSGDEEEEGDGINNIDDPPGESGKLAFGRRKIAFFDRVTAQEREKARVWLKRETEAAKKRDREILDTYLKNMQKIQVHSMKGQSDNNMLSGSPTTEEDFDFFMRKVLIHRGERGERFQQNNVDIKLPQDMSLSLNGAFILESLSFTSLESLEGMSKCYDGFISAGTALLEEDEKNKSQSFKSDDNVDSSNYNGIKNSKSKILTALATILITTLDYTSGETILALARLRAMCGTFRYKHRFTQRIAPLLIRPPNSAIWCLRHQSDMRAIVAVTELLFDKADDVFSHGWHDRGRILLADGRRAESLNAAARQLRSLSANALSSSFRRANSLLPSNTKANECSMDLSGKQHLAEWEVLAVDMQIRESINGLFSRDWAKIRGTPKTLSSSGNSVDGSVMQRRELRGSLSPRQSQVQLSPHSSINENVASNSSPRIQFASFSQQHIHSPSKSPTSSSKTSQRQSPLLMQKPYPQPIQQESNPQLHPHNQQHTRHSKQHQYPPKLSIPTEIQKSVQDYSSAPMTPKPMPVPPPLSTAPITPPRSPNSPKASKSRDHLLSTAPQMPNMSSSGQSMSVDTRVQAQPAPPLSPTPSNASSHHSQRSIHSTHSTTLSGSNRAADRRRTLAACRALRAQITRFEDSFITLHGRPPKGAAERAPLATTYAQYREWKRVIRADAACRIQALFRGFILRIQVLSNSSGGAAGDFFSRWREIILNVPRRTTLMNIPPGLSIPVEIEDVLVRGENSLSGFNGEEGRSNGVEVMISPRSEQQKHLPHKQIRSGGKWPRRNRSEGGRGGRASISPHLQGNNSQSLGSLSQEVRSVNSTSSANSSYSRGVDSTQSSSISIESMSLQELLNEKRSLKNLLKQYDMEFHSKHKRMPIKIEKEPIRHLYEKYNSLKSRIQMLSSGDNNSNSSTITTATATATANPQFGGRHSRSSGSTYNTNVDSGLDDGISEKSSLNSGRQQVRRDRSNSNSSSVPSGSSSSDRLEALKEEKTRLHQMLRSYERDFYREYQRQVSSFADIRPVASQYRRYKEIKKSIAALQEANPSSTGGGR